MSLVLGLVAVSLVVWRWIPLIGLAVSVVAVIVALPAIVMGHVALQRSRTLAREGRGLALAGLCTGYAMVAIAVVTPIVSAVLFLLGAAGFASEQLPEWIDGLAQFWERFWPES